MGTQEKSLIESMGLYIRQSVTLKLLVIFILMLLLMIPVAFVMELIHEREALRQSAIDEVSDRWAHAQQVYGPVLTLPFNRQVIEEGKVKVVRSEAHLLPSRLSVKGEVEPRQLHRGIYEVVVYDSRIAVNGSFEEIEKYIDELDGDEIMWKEAFLTINISDLRGIREEVTVNWNGRKIPVEPGTQVPGLVQTGITVNKVFLQPPGAEALPFSFNLHLQGSRSLGFSPLGKETLVKLSSNWPEPSFSGSFLPDERTVNAGGFTASYKILQLNRNYPQFWVGDQHAASVQNSAFGVDFLLPASDYQKATRSAKYALLVVALTFLTFFLVEVFSKKSLHPFQYVLVGLALVVFYILLISISEHSSFNVAYLISSVIVIAMTGLYAKSILNSLKQSLILTGILGLAYLFVYVILQVQDYALLIGSSGLTAILAATMYITRNINWYGLNAQQKAPSVKE